MGNLSVKLTLTKKNYLLRIVGGSYTLEFSTKLEVAKQEYMLAVFMHLKSS